MTDDERSDADLAACSPTPLARLGGGLTMIAGLFTLVQAVQLWTFVLIGWVAAVPYVLVAAGVATIALGFFVTRMRGWAAIASMVLSGAMTAVHSMWGLYGMTREFVSLVGFLMPPLTLAASVATGLVIGAALRADQARARLMADGLGLGT